MGLFGIGKRSKEKSTELVMLFLREVKRGGVGPLELGSFFITMVV